MSARIMYSVYITRTLNDVRIYVGAGTRVPQMVTESSANDRLTSEAESKRILL